mmetsp:Transcript_2046/g.5585  ORF Transcript_2046/g.5585 Transcript_2046/m.5585 type:complete len:226 (+) Transcript_2046:1215-1892(+)
MLLGKGRERREVFERLGELTELLLGLFHLANLLAEHQDLLLVYFHLLEGLVLLQLALLESIPGQCDLPLERPICFLLPAEDLLLLRDLLEHLLVLLVLRRQVHRQVLELLLQLLFHLLVALVLLDLRREHPLLSLQLLDCHLLVHLVLHHLLVVLPQFLVLLPRCCELPLQEGHLSVLFHGIRRILLDHPPQPRLLALVHVNAFPEFTQYRQLLPRVPELRTPHR